MPDLKWCSFHKTHEPIQHFHKNKYRRDGLNTECRLAGSLRNARHTLAKGGTPRLPKPDTSPPGMTWCVHHQMFCPTDTFCKSKKSRNGLTPSCQKAASEKAGRISNKVSKYNPAPNGFRWCTFHQKFQPISEFGSENISYNNRTGLPSSCREGKRLYAKSYQATLEGKLTDKAAKHRRRIRKLLKSGKITKEDIERIINNAKKCHVCGKRFTKLDPPTIDHVLAISNKLGTHAASNLAPAHGSCNSRKNKSRFNPITGQGFLL